MEYVAKLVEALHLAVFSYIKPAAPHRFSTRFRDLESMVFTVTSSLDVYGQAFAAGLSVGSGKETLYTVGVGNLLYTSLAKSYRRLGARAHQTLNLVLIPSTLAIACSLRQRPFASSFRRILSAVLGIDNPRDVAGLVEGVRQFHGIGSQVLAELGLTSSRLATERPSLGDVFSALGTRARDLRYTLERLDYVVEVGAEAGRELARGSDPNDVAVRAFLKLAQPECERLGRATEVDQKVLYELDRELSREGIDLSYLLAPLTLALKLSYYLGGR